GLVALAFRDRLGLGRVDDLVGALVGLLDDLVGLDPRRLQFVGDAFLGLGEVLLRVVRGREALGDLLLAFLDRPHQRRPDELPGEPDQDREREALAQECGVELHRDAPRLAHGRGITPDPDRTPCTGARPAAWFRPPAARSAAGWRTRRTARSRGR